MPYFQEGPDIYWWDPDARKRRTVSPDTYSQSARPPHRRHLNDLRDPEDPDPHHVRDTTVRAPADR